LSFETARFVDDSFEETNNRRVIERPGVGCLHSIKDSLFPLRIVDGYPKVLFELSDLECQRSPFVEDPEEIIVECVDSFPYLGDIQRGLPVPLKCLLYDGVLFPVGIVCIGVVDGVVEPATLLAIQGATHDQFSDCRYVAQFDQI